MTMAPEAMAVVETTRRKAALRTARTAMALLPPHAINHTKASTRHASRILLYTHDKPFTHNCSHARLLTRTCVTLFTPFTESPSHCKHAYSHATIAAFCFYSRHPPAFIHGTRRHREKKCIRLSQSRPHSVHLRVHPRQALPSHTSCVTTHPRINQHAPQGGIYAAFVRIRIACLRSTQDQPLSVCTQRSYTSW